jgi:SsrA-binding protein
MMIDEYKLGTFYNHKTKREEVACTKENCKNLKKVKDVGNTIIPLKLYIMIKVKQTLIGFGRGKNF